MAHTRRTLRLGEGKWDLTLDGIGKIALAGDEAATAQNVANAARLFTEDAYFAQDQGIPHFLAPLGQRANISVLRSYLRKAALGVPDVKEVISVDIGEFDPKTRSVSGEIQFTTMEGAGNGTIRTKF